jgi:N-acyl-L-homoserine lactone synthetase
VDGSLRQENAQVAYEAVWAKHLDEVRLAQQLRYEVFAGEMGAKLDGTLNAQHPGHDIDVFDDYCEHLLVREVNSGMVVGTYRLLTPTQAKRAGGFYTDTEFDLTRLRGMRSQMVELGRSCVHAGHRSGGVILTLWSALAQFMTRNNLQTMVGCASIPMNTSTVAGASSADVAASIWASLKDKHLAEAAQRPRRGAARAHQGLSASWGQAAGCACLGPRLQHRRSAHSHAHERLACPLPQALRRKLIELSRAPGRVLKSGASVATPMQARPDDGDQVAGRFCEPG